MIRYINADDVHRTISKVWVDMSIGDILIYMNMLDNAIDDLPSADVVEVVRCKDCKLLFSERCPKQSNWSRNHDDYCSYGERKDG